MRLISIFLLWFFGVIPLWAETSPAAIQFLKALDLRYYCLNREGLKNFKCEMKMTIPAGYAQRMKEDLRRNNIFQGDQCVEALNAIQYILTVEDGDAKVELVQPVTIGDPKADDFIFRQASAYEHMTEKVFKMWVQMTVDPFYSDSDFKHADFQVQKTNDGFTVVSNDPKEGNITSYFDSKANMVNSEGTVGPMAIRMKTNFNPSQKGFVLGSWDMKIGELGYQGSINYAVVDKYYLPQKWTFDFMIPGALAEEDEFTLEFSHYLLNNAAKLNRPLVIVVGKTIQPTYHHDFSVADIEGHTKDWVPSWNRHELGLTEFRYNTGYQFQTGWFNNPDKDKALIWLTTLDVDFSIAKFEVYIAAQYPEGSCPYRAILDHENTHVAINKRTYEKYKVIMLKAFQNDSILPTKAHPWTAEDPTKGKYMIEQHVAKMINGVLKRFWAEMGMANAKIDLPSSYRQVQAKCKDW